MTPPASYHGFRRTGDRLVTPAELAAAVPWLTVRVQTDLRYEGRLSYRRRTFNDTRGLLRTTKGSVRYWEPDLWTFFHQWQAVEVCA